MMPPQLARAKRPKRSTPRPLVEELPRIEIVDLCRFGAFPSQTNWHTRYLLELPFRYPFLRNLVISLQIIEANHHFGYTQRIPLRWLRTGLGGNHSPRPLFVCSCGRSITKIYFKAGRLACHRCHGAIFASQACSKRQRPILQARRLKTFLELKSGMWKSNQRRLKARIATATSQHLNSKRLAHHSIPMPSSNHRTRGAMHWR
jgi:hypothetical protein